MSARARRALPPELVSVYVQSLTDALGRAPTTSEWKSVVRHFWKMNDRIRKELERQPVVTPIHS